MSGFDPEWLALREPVDHASINHRVRHRLLDHFSNAADVRIVDLGCGTGSNFRGLAPEIGARQSWLLVDYDGDLLARARQDTGPLAERQSIVVETRQADLSSGAIGELIAEADLVTAAALFDLVSPSVIEKMADEIARAGAVFATVLTYDGIASWLPTQVHDDAIRTAFNAHQRRDKGFGAAAGADATDILERAFTAHGYTIVRGKSAWVLDRNFRELRLASDQGWASAAGETGDVEAADVAAWIAHRQSREDAVTIVGHDDILALPPADPAPATRGRTRRRISPDAG